MSDSPNTPSEWASYLKTNWDRRSRSDQRNYFIAPQGFGNSAAWDAQGHHLAEAMLTDLSADWLKDQDVLEIGCGVGRLAKTWVPRTKTFAGIDVSPGMIEEARKQFPSSIPLLRYEYTCIYASIHKPE